MHSFNGLILGNCVQSLQDKHAQRMIDCQLMPDRGFTCDIICSRVCASRIGLFSHHRSSPISSSSDPEIRRPDGSAQQQCPFLLINSVC